MPIQSGFFNSIDGDRKYDAEDVNRFFDGVLYEGVSQYIGDTLLVIPSSGMQIGVGSGKAWFLKSWIENSSDAFRTLADADVTYDRIDIIALDFDKSDEVRDNTVIIVEGTPAASPVPPTLIDTSTHIQKPLAHILVEANETVIQAGDITNKVGTVDCPFSAGLTDLIVSVDDSTIEIFANDLRVKPDGITPTELADNSVGPTEIQNNAVRDVELADDAVGSDQLADDAVNSEHIAAGALDAEHYATGSVGALAIQNDSVRDIELAPLSVGTPELIDDAVTQDKMADDSVGTNQIKDNAITNSHFATGVVDTPELAVDAVDGTKIANNAVNSEHIAAGALDTEHYADGSVGAVAIQNDSVRSEELAALAVGTPELADNSVDDDKVGDRVPMLPGRKGGSAITWSSPGTSTYVPNAVKMYCGSVNIASIPDGDEVSVGITFPQAFTGFPMVLATAENPKCSVRVQISSETNAALWVHNQSGGTSTDCSIYWIAIGEE